MKFLEDTKKTESFKKIVIQKNNLDNILWFGVGGGTLVIIVEIVQWTLATHMGAISIAINVQHHATKNILNFRYNFLQIKRWS